MGNASCHQAPDVQNGPCAPPASGQPCLPGWGGGGDRALAQLLTHSRLPSFWGSTLTPTTSQLTHGWRGCQCHCPASNGAPLPLLRSALYRLSTPGRGRQEPSSRRSNLGLQNSLSGEPQVRGIRTQQILPWAERELREAAGPEGGSGRGPHLPLFCRHQPILSTSTA